MEGGKALQFLHHLGNTIGRPHPHKQVQVIGLESESENVPLFLLTLLLNELLTAFFELAHENRLASFWAPDEMAHNEVDTVFISLVFKFGWLCCFHSCFYTAYSTNVQQVRAKAWEKPAYPPGMNPQRLAAGASLSQTSGEVFFRVWESLCFLEGVCFILSWIGM